MSQIFLDYLFCVYFKDLHEIFYSWIFLYTDSVNVKIILVVKHSEIKILISNYTTFHQELKIFTITVNCYYKITL